MHEYGTRELGTVETRYGGGHPWFAGNPETVRRFGRERPGITFRLAGARHPMLHRFRGAKLTFRRLPRSLRVCSGRSAIQGGRRDRLGDAERPPN